MSVAMTADKLREEIKLDDSYKYIHQVVNGTVKIAKFKGNLSAYNYDRDRLTVTHDGLVMYKGSRFLVPEVLRPGLLRALHTGHAGVVSMITRAKEVFWWPGITADIELLRANCWVCHENAPSQPKQPSIGVLKTKYAFKALSMDHFFEGFGILGNSRPLFRHAQCPFHSSPRSKRATQNSESTLSAVRYTQVYIY